MAGGHTPGDGATPGAPSGDWTPKQVDALREMLAAGMSFAKIAARLDRTRSAVSGKIARLGLSANANASKAPSIEAVVKDRRDARPANQVYATGPAASPRPWSCDARVPADPATCRFMIDNGQGIRDPNWRWCGAVAVGGTAWCAAHHALVYRPASAEERAA